MATEIGSKFQYLSKTFNRRTKGKDYENFVLNAIYSRIDNPNLIPVTQKNVRIPGTDKKYLLALFFPQLDYYIEVDESYHFTPEQQAEDEQRRKEIRAATGYTEGRIAICKTSETLRTYEDVNTQIDEEVAKIKRMIADKEAQGKKLVWNDFDLSV